MLRPVPPRIDGLIIPEKRKRKQLSGLGEALESLDGDEAVNSPEVCLQPSRQVQIGVAAAVSAWPDLEDHRDHGRTGGAWGSEASFRNIRSSFRMNCSRLANS